MTSTLKALAAMVGLLSLSSAQAAYEFHIPTKGLTVALPTCALPWGGTLTHGNTVKAYLTSSVPYGETCASEIRSCANGTLSGTYPAASCSVAAAAACPLPWGGQLASGATVAAYTASSSADCANAQTTVSCTNGVLSNSSVYPSCTVVDTYSGSTVVLAHFDGTVANQVSATTITANGGLTANGTGWSGNAVSLGAQASQYLSFPGLTPGSLLRADSALTVEYWTYLTAYSGSTLPNGFGEFQYNGGYNAWSFGPDNTGKLSLYWWTGSQNHMKGVTSIPLNTWNHVALSAYGGTVRLFLNGKLEASGSIATPTATTGLMFGGYSNSLYRGSIDELRVTKAARYLSNFTPPAAPFPAP